MSCGPIRALAEMAFVAGLVESDVNQDISSAELKSLREAAGVDLAVLARRVSLSPAQVKQLESGQDSLFYSPAIRRQAALKVYQYLDAQLQSPAAARRA